MQVLITGGTGFIGSRLVRSCLEHGEQVRVVGQTNTEAESDNLNRLRDLGCQIELGSVTDEQQVRGAMDGVQVVYHLAAAQHEAGRSDEHFRNVNVTGTRMMLTAAAEAGVQRFVHGSTIGVYQAGGGRVVRDDSPTVPNNIYGVTKLEAEGVVAEFHDRVPSVTIRISETYGPGDRRLLKLFRAIKKGKYFHIGRGDNLHHLLYVEDLVAALRLAAGSPSAVGQTMVVPGYEVTTSRQMAELIAQVLGVDKPKLTVPLGPLWTTAVVMEALARPFGITPPLHRRRMHFFVNSYEFSGQAARQLLGYEPRVPAADGLSRTAEWYRQTGLL